MAKPFYFSILCYNLDYITFYKIRLSPIYYAVRYRVPLSTSKWAKYIDKETIVKPLSLYKSYRVFTQQINFF